LHSRPSQEDERVNPQETIMALFSVLSRRVAKRRPSG
jgi:hypothetical protein